jgi:transposase
MIRHNRGMAEEQASHSSGFSWRDRRRLVRALQETRDVRLFRRLQAVLRVAEGCPLSEVSRQASVDRSSLHRWVKLYLQTHQVENLIDAARSGRPREADDLDEELLAEVLALDPREQGYWATTWTVPLLTTYLREQYGCPGSTRTLRRRLHDWGWRWKRPRYVFSERAPHLAQKKGRSAAA